MKAVVNATSLIALSRIKRLHLLKELFQKVYLSRSVYDEVVREDKPGVESVKSAEWLILKTPQNTLAVQILELILDSGEASTIVVGLEEGVDFVVLDEKIARRVANNLGLHVTGTVGLLLECKKRGIVSEINPLLSELKEVGFWISDSLFRRALVLANERCKR